MKTKIALILFPLCISMVLLSCGPTSENAKNMTMNWLIN